MSRISSYLRAIDQDAVDHYHNSLNYRKGRISRKRYLKRENEILHLKQTTLDAGVEK